MAKKVGKKQKSLPAVKRAEGLAEQVVKCRLKEQFLKKVNDQLDFEEERELQRRDNAQQRIENMAMALRAAYSRERELAPPRPGMINNTNGRFLLGNFYQDRNRFIWEKLAETALVNEMLPHLFMQRAFNWARANWPNRAFPSVIDLLGDQFFQEYESVKETENYRAFSQLQFSLDRLGVFLRAAIRNRGKKSSDASVLISAMVDPVAQLSPLFIYCVAVKHALHRVVEYFLDRAVMQYMSRSESYDKFWQDWLPADFGALARRRYLALWSRTASS